MNNETLVPLLEEYVNQMKIEMKNLNDCGYTLKSEIKILQNTVASGADKKRKCDDIFLSYESRMRDIEKKEGDIKGIAAQLKSDKELLENKLDSTKDSVKGITGQLQGVGTSILALFLGVIAKFIT